MPSEAGNVSLGNCCIEVQNVAIITFIQVTKDLSCCWYILHKSSIDGASTVMNTFSFSFSFPFISISDLYVFPSSCRGRTPFYFLVVLSKHSNTCYEHVGLIYLIGTCRFSVMLDAEVAGHVGTWYRRVLRWQRVDEVADHTDIYYIKGLFGSQGSSACSLVLSLQCYSRI